MYQQLSLLRPSVAGKLIQVPWGVIPVSVPFMMRGMPGVGKRVLGVEMVGKMGLAGLAGLHGWLDGKLCPCRGNSQRLGPSSSILTPTFTRLESHKKSQRDFVDVFSQHGALVQTPRVLLGLPGFDVELAYEAIRKDAFEIPPSVEPGTLLHGVGRVALKSYLVGG